MMTKFQKYTYYLLTTKTFLNVAYHPDFRTQFLGQQVMLSKVKYCIFTNIFIIHLPLQPCTVQRTIYFAHRRQHEQELGLYKSFIILHLSNTSKNILIKYYRYQNISGKIPQKVAASSSAPPVKYHIIQLLVAHWYIDNFLIMYLL